MKLPGNFGLGIDFSGNHLMWRPGCGRSNVWISDVRSCASQGPDRIFLFLPCAREATVDPVRRALFSGGPDFIYVRTAGPHKKGGRVALPPFPFRPVGVTAALLRRPGGPPAPAVPGRLPGAVKPRRVVSCDEWVVL